MTSGLEAGLLAALLTLGAIALERRGMAPDLPSASRRQAWTAAAVVAVVFLGGFSLIVGNPITKISDEVDKVSSSDTSYSEVQGSRFTYAGGLNRINFWEVALDQFHDAPIQGGGAGSYRSTYLVKGDGSEAPRNAHSLPLETLGELGLIGLGLLVTGFGAAAVAAWRSRRLGPEAVTISTVALVVGAVALAQASVDWSWYFGGQIAPMFGLLGSAAAPAALALNPVAERVRRGVVLAAVLLAVIAVPTFASERLTLSAAQNWHSDLDGAYSALSTATSLNPFADVPLLVEAQIAKESHDAPRALDALADARSREPDDWRSYDLAAQVLKSSDPEQALVEAEQAYALNPSNLDVKALRRSLQKATGSPDS
jgi:O-antigen ligase